MSHLGWGGSDDDLLHVGGRGRLLSRSEVDVRLDPGGDWTRLHSHISVSPHTLNKGRFQKFMLGRLVHFSVKWVDGVLLVAGPLRKIMLSGWVGGVRVHFSPLIVH